MFCFGCGCMGYVLRECESISLEVKELSKKELPCTFKAGSKMRSKESILFGITNRSDLKHKFYVGANDNSEEGGTLFFAKSSNSCFYHKGKEQVVIDGKEKVVLDLEPSSLVIDWRSG